jgi:hypothetical protein
VCIVEWFPEGLGVACIAVDFSQDNEKAIAHFPLTYFLEGDLIIAGVVLAGLTACLDVPFSTSYGKQCYEDYAELDELYLPILRW